MSPFGVICLHPITYLNVKHVYMTCGNHVLMRVFLYENFHTLNRYGEFVGIFHSMILNCFSCIVVMIPYPYEKNLYFQFSLSIYLHKQWQISKALSCVMGLIFPRGRNRSLLLLAAWSWIWHCERPNPQWQLMRVLLIRMHKWEVEEVHIHESYVHGTFNLDRNLVYYIHLFKW